MRTVSLLLFVLSLAVPLSARTRWHQYHKAHKNPSRPVTPRMASWLGGSGTEWLSGGGFFADGTVVVAGTTVGPTFDLGNKQAAVLGRDTAPPDPASTVTRTWTRMRKGKEVTRSRTTEVDLGPDRPGSTGFVALVDKHLREVVQVVRFPWNAGAITDCVVSEDDRIYLTGPAGAQVSNLPGLRRMRGKGDKAVFVVKLGPRLQPEWATLIPSDGTRAPVIDLDSRGVLHLTGGVYHQINSRSGAVISSQDLPDNSEAVAVNPVNGSFAAGGDHNTGTGREPWRRPYLNIFAPDGDLYLQLYRWDARLVGTNMSRLVSDSAIRHLKYSDDGKSLWMIAWSDGGNSVMNKQPFDLHREVDSNGLGMSAWGISVSSLCYLLKMNAETYEVESKTLWLAYLKNENKPNGARLTSLEIASDGSVLAAGGSASGLIQTGNHFPVGRPAIRNEGRVKGEWAPGGRHVVIFEPDLSGLRYSSIMRGCGVVKLDGDDRSWAIARRTFGDRERVLYVGSAEKEDAPGKYYAESMPPPSLNPLQTKYGGGESDGYLMILDL